MPAGRAAVPAGITGAIAQSPTSNRDSSNARGALYLSLGFAAALVILMLAIPGILNLDRGFLLRSAGWNGQTYGESLLTGIFHRTCDTPRPLWDVFWLLSRNPASLYPLVALMVGVLAFIFTLLSRQVFKSVVPGVFCSLIVTFSYLNYLDDFLSGGGALAYLVLALSALYFYLRQRLLLFALFLFLSALIRPESWMLAVYFIGLHIIRRRFSLVLLLPLLAPLLWVLYDWRMSGNPLYSYLATRDYAWYSGSKTTGFLEFWPSVGWQFKDIMGWPNLLLGLAAIAYRVWLKRGKELLTDPVLIFIFVPLFFSWLTTLKGDLFIMGRFYATSLALLAFAAFFVPFAQPQKRRSVMTYIFLFLPLLFAGIRAPAVWKAAGKRLQAGIHAAKIAVKEAEYVKETDVSAYHHILIPYRRYGEFYQLLGESCYQKLISYRELRRKATNGHDRAALLPSLALWITGDESYPPVFKDLHNGKSVVESLGEQDVRISFDLLRRTTEEGGYVYEATTVPAAP